MINEKRKNRLTNKQIEIAHEIAMKNTVKCSCGHSVVITNRYNRTLCKWCGKWVFKTKKDEFIYRLNEAKIREGKNG